MKLDGYIRVSATRGREGDSFISPDQQREKIEQWAALRGVEIAKWHTDLDQTGGKLSRPGFDKALARVASSDTGGIVVAKLDRFSRAGVADALNLIESIHDAGGEVASVEEGIDPTTPFGEFAMTVLLALSRMQRRQIGDNWRDARSRAVERGVHVASRAPTGYERGDDGRLVVNPQAAPHIAEVFRMKANGASWRDLCNHLRKHNVESPYGTTNWMPRAIGHMISNRAYLGEARSGEYRNPDAHEPILKRDDGTPDEALWQAAQEAKGKRPVNGLGGSLLAGLLRCEGCGYVLKPDTMKQRGVNRRLYRCRTERSSGRCPSPASVLGTVVEPFVLDHFMRGLRGMRAEGVAVAEDLKATEAALTTARRELDTYIAAVSAADVGAVAFANGARQRREAVERAQTALNEARERAGLADLPLAADLEADWPNLTTQQRNKLLRAGLDAVMIGRGRVPIAERATVYWRGECPPERMKGRG
ncbi:MAG TPA: recombinase family protein [Solirubrobacter sp.]|nr:recombinase family protein [Solirubrobacter sp.]